MIWRKLWLWGRLTAVFLFIFLFFAPEWPTFGDRFYQIKTIVDLRQFDFLGWEMEAVTQKAQALLAKDHAYLSPPERRRVVEEYLGHLGDALRLEAEMRAVYADPDVADPAAETAVLQAQLGLAREQAAQLQPLAEAIVQEQVAWALRQEGFAFLGQAWPPVLMHMTPLPSLLVVSPRERIESLHQVSLQHGLTVADWEEMETAVRENLDLSALVVPIGGMGTYPAMIMETANLQWLIEVTAHEWTHHWLTLQPLGIRYAQDPQMRIINETVASLVDVEIRDRVLEQFYPDLVLPPPPETPPDAAEPEPPAFDFRAEMAETRLVVDELLADGQILAAEMYMEARRQVFLNNGYRLRKLNQAYFAFYGAYAAQPGATGGDPIGPMLRDIRERSDSLAAFMAEVAPIREYADLVVLHGERGE